MKKLVTHEELEQQFIELINDINNPIIIGSYTYEAGYAFKKIDPIAFKYELEKNINLLVEDNVLEEIEGDYYEV